MSGIFVDIAQKQPIAQSCDRKCDFCRPGIQWLQMKKATPFQEWPRSTLQVSYAPRIRRCCRA